MRASGMLGQFVRYAITGGGVTLLGAGLYLAIVGSSAIHPQAAMFLAYLACVAVGYFLHSRWSFRGHGTRDARRTTFRFFVASGISYGLNAFWTWLCVAALGLPEWTPALPLVFVTPIAMFAINRQWVFG